MQTLPARFSVDNFSILYLPFWTKQAGKTPGSRIFFADEKKNNDGIQVFFTYCHRIHKFLFSEEKTASVFSSDIYALIQFPFCWYKLLLP